MNVAVSNVPGPRERGHIGGAPVSEIYSVGVLSAGSAFNMTVWSYVDQLDIAVLSDDQTFEDLHEATDAMVHAFGEIRRAAASRDPTTVEHRDGARDRGRLDRSTRETAFAGQIVQRGLHHRADMSVDLVDIGVVAELRGDVDRLEHTGDDLGGQRQVGRQDHRKPERETEADRQDLHRAQRFSPSRRAMESPRARNSWVSWPPIDTIGTIGTPASMAVRT